MSCDADTASRRILGSHREAETRDLLFGSRIADFGSLAIGRRDYGRSQQSSGNIHII